MNLLPVHTRVLVRGSLSRRSGIIAQHHPVPGADYPYLVTFDDGGRLWCSEHETRFNRCTPDGTKGG